jgi:hypothetical protein
VWVEHVTLRLHTRSWLLKLQGKGYKRDKLTTLAVSLVHERSQTCASHQLDKEGSRRTVLTEST